MLTSITTGMAQLDGICKRLSMDGQSDELKNLEKRLKNHIFSVGIMGEFRRGKSTVINALLGQEIVPSDIVPCSATLNYVKWDVNRGAEIYFKDGSVQSVDVEDLSKYVTKITKESEEMSAKVEKAVVYYPCQFCQNGVQIIDTPGLNDDERMSDISEKVIPTLDAIIMVIVPDSPFSQSEAEFVRNKVMASDLGRIIFVVNKIDTIDEDDRDRLLDSIRDKIKSSVLDKIAKIYGEDSDEYRNTLDKMGSIKLLPISARKALKGKIKNNPSMFEDSGYAEFESTLSYLLTEERGTLELMHPVNQMFSVSSEAMMIIETRLATLNMESEEFESKQKEALGRLEETRERKKVEIGALKNKGVTLYSTLLPELSGIYDEIEASLFDFVSNYEITNDVIKDKAAITAFSERIAGEIDAKMQDALTVHTERLVYRIQEQLGTDVSGLEEFGKEFNNSMNDIHVSLSLSKTNRRDHTVSTLIDAGVIFGGALFFGTVIPGVGALVSGFKDHGVKGAVVGGLAGAACGIAAGLLAAPLGVVGIPLALVMGSVSAFGGKTITNLIFGKKKEIDNNINKVRESLVATVAKVMDEFKRSHNLENWLKETCETSYNSIADDIDREWENTLVSMENTLTQIKVDLSMEAANKAKIENDMQTYASEISEIIATINPIKNKLSASLQN
ncbi:MAG: dynamin family protein [Clostridia bacterium]|nr:dynamin family protein [Clostridia bacterium]